MTATPSNTKTPAGGPSTIEGVIYQMLWCLLRLTRYEVRRIDVAGDSRVESAVLVLEPRGGGGDAREVREAAYTVTQLKSRSGGGTWSLQEVIKDVLPDLLKAVKMDATNPIYQFVTDGRRGDWEQVERFFLSLRTREPGDDPPANLDDTNPLKVGARLSKEAKTDVFWKKDRYTERELFAKVVDELSSGLAIAARADAERVVWHLLGHFEFSLPLSTVDAEKEIDLALSELVERVEDIPDRRGALLVRLADLARKGNAVIELKTFLQNQGLKAIPRGHVAALQARSREVVIGRVRRCGFDGSQHVQASFTESLIATISEVPVVALVGDSGCGKSWHSYALAEALSQRGALVAHVEAAESARTTLDIGLGVLWNTVKGQDGTLPYDRAAKGLPGPPPTRVLIVDRVDDPAIARDLALAGLEDLGVRLVVAVSVQASGSFGGGPVRCRTIDVPGFSPSELEDYLVARRVARSESIPADVRELLAQPMLARIYCDLAVGAVRSPKTEYELFREYWKRRLEGNQPVIPTLDVSLLRDLARALLGDEPYPWRSGLVNKHVKHEGSLGRLQRTGWFMVHPAGECALWHDRLLNWLVADTVVEDFLSGRRKVDDLSKLVASSFSGELKAGGRWMGYVAMDALWLLAERGAPAAVFATMLASLEKTNHSHSLYTKMVPTLGERAIAGLLARLDQHLSGELSYRSIEIASCLAVIASPEAVVKARALLMSGSVEHHTLALEILRRQGDPASLDRLWGLHVEAREMPNGLVDYQRRMDALEAGINLRPEWLVAQLKEAASDTRGLPDLVYLLARLPDGGQAWRSLKAHLKRVVPEGKRRCLVRCITVFRDTTEIDFVRGERNRDTDMVGDAALAALTRLSPQLAIQDLARSELRYLAFTRGWHLHRLLAAMPEQTQEAVRALVDPTPARFRELYAGAENEIDGKGFEYVLDLLETALGHALSEKPVDPSAGAVHASLGFVERVCRPDLLMRMRERHGSDLEAKLAQYLLAIGPRDDVNARLCDRSALATLEFLESEQLPRIMEAGLDASSWYGRIDAAKHVHKHTDSAVLTKLRVLAGVRDGDDNNKFVAYVAIHALCFLEDWEGVLPVVVHSGLAVSPYLFEQRREQPPLTGPQAESIRARIAAGELSPGVLLAAGLCRDPALIAPINAAFATRTLGRDEALSAAIALDVLDAKDQSVVKALASHLGDETLRERFLGFLLAIDTPESLAAVADAVAERFDAEICALLGKRDRFADRAAQLAWQNRAAAQRSLSYGMIVPLFGRIATQESRAYLEKLAYGVGRTAFGQSLRVPAIQGLAVNDPDTAFRAAESSLRDRVCEERHSMASVLMELDAERAVPVLMEVLRTADNESMELAVADELATTKVEAEIAAMLDSEAQEVRRVGCVLAGRHTNSRHFRSVLRARALDIEETVATAAMKALREQIRAEAVAALVKEALDAPEKSRRWILLDRLARHARGRKDIPPVLRSILAPLDEAITPLEASRFNEEMKQGLDEFQRGVKDRADRKALLT